MEGGPGDGVGCQPEGKSGRSMSDSGSVRICHAVAVTGLTLETRATVGVVVTGSTGGVWTGGRGRVSASG